MNHCERRDAKAQEKNEATPTGQSLIRIPIAHVAIEWIGPKSIFSVGNLLLIERSSKPAHFGPPFPGMYDSEPRLSLSV